MVCNRAEDLQVSSLFSDKLCFISFKKQKKTVAIYYGYKISDNMT